MIELADLAVLIEAAQQGSLSAAGRRLGLTPVAASRRGRLVQITLPDGAVPDQGTWAVLPTWRLIPRKVHLFLDELSNHLSGPDRQPAEAGR
jgi:DNA-binding transcriptional LysR family regulator